MNCDKEENIADGLESCIEWKARADALRANANYWYNESETWKNRSYGMSVLFLISITVFAVSVILFG